MGRESGKPIEKSNSHQTTVEEIAAVEGIGSRLAENVVTFLKRRENQPLGQPGF